MKNLFLVALLFVVVSCQKENLVNENPTSVFENQLKTDPVGYPDDELVIYYRDGTSDLEKELLRFDFNVTEFENCNCADSNLELWIMDMSTGGTNGGSIEDQRESAESRNEIEGADFNKSFSVAGDMFVSTGSSDMEEAMNRRVMANDGVTVAILDTGIEYDYHTLPDSYLFNNNAYGCEDNGYTDLFGWNFVDKSNDPYDDYSGKHGTAVAHFISAQLVSQNQDFQILPVKIADSGGNIRYFDAVCGFKYAANNPEVDVINMSFGFYEDGYQLLGEFIAEASNEKIVIASAGNNGGNNDEVAHYPSSFQANNILSVASLAGGGTMETGQNPGLASFSNFGPNSVDLATDGVNLPFLYDGEVNYLSGTSYSTAIASGNVAAGMPQGASPSSVINQTVANSIYSPKLHKIQYSKYLNLLD